MCLRVAYLAGSQCSNFGDLTHRLTGTSKDHTRLVQAVHDICAVGKGCNGLKWQSNVSIAIPLLWSCPACNLQRNEVLHSISKRALGTVLQSVVLDAGCQRNYIKMLSLKC